MSPIRIGSGMRMKILDAVSQKAPFLLLPLKELRGINFHHEECLIADKALEFASAVIRLAGDPDLQVKLAKSGCGTVAESYIARKKMLDRRLAVYNQIL